MNIIKIIQQKNPEDLIAVGDILMPRGSSSCSKTGGKWFSKVSNDFYDTKKFIPLNAFSQNSWKALEKIGVGYHEFKEKVEYNCPYNDYNHYWAVPVILFCEDVKFWLDRGGLPEMRKQMYMDEEWMRSCSSPRTKNGFRFSKVQRALLGSGYTYGTMVQDGIGQVHDGLVTLENGDFLGCKVWVWFNK